LNQFFSNHLHTGLTTPATKLGETGGNKCYQASNNIYMEA